MNWYVLVKTVGRMCLLIGIVVIVFSGWLTIGVPLVMLGVLSQIARAFLPGR